MKRVVLQNLVNRISSSIGNRNSEKCFSSNVTSDGILKSFAPELKVPRGNYTNFVLQNALKWQNLTALECSRTGYKITYAQLIDQSRRWSGVLKKIGIGRGDVVSLIAPNCPQFGPLILGTTAIGAIISPINFRYTSGEIIHLLKSNDAKILIMSEELETTVEEALNEIKKPVQQFCIGTSKKGHPNINHLLHDNSLPFMDPADISGDETVYLPFSSGTTGLPKAVAISHNAFIANILQFTNPYHALIPHTAADGPQEVYLGMLPFFHIYGMLAILTIGLYSGAKIVTLPQFDPTAFISTVINHKIGLLHTVPTLIHFLNSRNECNPRNMGHIHTVFCGSAPVLPSSSQVFCNKLEKEIAFLEGYGMTEVLLAFASPRYGSRLGFAGQLLSNVETKIVDPETGHSLGVNEAGEIWLQTPARMLYYLGNPTATAEMITDDGWIRTGDIGVYNEDGYFSIIDRTKDLIKVKGLQVSPSEIEDVLQSHPSVLESSVIGIPDECLGEAPKAFVVLKGKATAEDLTRHVASKLSKHKHLVGGVALVDSLPKSGTGKVLKRVLRQ